MKRFKLLLTLAVIFIPLAVVCQNPIGMPDIINYEKNTYGAGTQNWAIQQDKNGILYFANNEGLLTYDGIYWKTYPLPNKTIVRSLAIAEDQKIYVGGQGDFGYFTPATNGKLQFISLREKLPSAYRSFADIWDITAVGKEIFFRSEKSIFKLAANKITVYPSTSEWVFLGKANGKIIAQDKKEGLLSYQNDQWLPLITAKLPADFMTTSVSSYTKDTILLSSWQNGLYTIANQNLSKLVGYRSDRYANEQIADAFKLNDEMMVIGTNINGCYLVNKKGSIVYNFSRKLGLQNNAVLSLLKDNNNNLWLGLNNGIDFIANNDAVKHINPEIFDEGVGHYALVHHQNLYVGLSGAVFKLPLPNSSDISLLKNDFQFVANTGGQAWGMNVVNDHLLLGKHEGAFEIKEKTTLQFAGNKGYWNFYAYPNGKSDMILAGNYTGIDFFNYKNGIFSAAGKIKDFTESARFIAVANSQLVWASHPYKGVYKINLQEIDQPRIKLYTHKNGLPSTFNNHVYQLKNRIVVSTEKGIYEYNLQKDKFEPSAYFGKIFGNMYIRYLKEDRAGNIWFIQEKNLGVCDFSKQKPQLIYIPELNGKLVSGFEHINPIDKNNVLVGAQKGFYHINYEKYLQSDLDVKVRISVVKAIGQADSLLFGGYFGEVNEGKTQTVKPIVKYGLNSFHFEYAAVMHKNQLNIKYSYYLEGFDQSWSSFSKKTEKDYTNLPHGKYTFHVKSKNNFGNESTVTSFQFTILPPWYQSLVAYLCYILLILYLIYYGYKRQQKKFLKQKVEFQKEQDRILYLHQLEMDKSEKEIIKLKNEKLKTEIELKDSELASTSMHLVQKSELLSKIKSDLNKLNADAPPDEHVHDLKKIIRQITTDEKTDVGWDQFSFYFDKVHTNFLEDLKALFPSITSNDVKLSAYLKLGLSTKEIAHIMKISPRGVEISRYRLRKKLRVPGEVNLFDFFMDFKKDNDPEGSSLEDDRIG